MAPGGPDEDGIAAGRRQRHGQVELESARGVLAARAISGAFARARAGARGGAVAFGRQPPYDRERTPQEVPRTGKVAVGDAAAYLGASHLFPVDEERRPDR